MTYNKTTWKTGDVITQEKLNHIEDGIGDSLDVDASNISDIGKSNLSGLSISSNRYIDLTLGASDSTYTAPANGWFYVYGVSGGIAFINTSKNNYTLTISDIAKFYGAHGIFPVAKGDQVQIKYSTSSSGMRFIYAEGDQ